MKIEDIVRRILEVPLYTSIRIDPISNVEQDCNDPPGPYGWQGHFAIIPNCDAAFGMLREWIGGAWLREVATDGLGGHRNHDSGGGYSVNVKPHAAVWVRHYPGHYEVCVDFIRA